MISDIVLLKELPDTVKKSVRAYIGCLSGAVMKDKYIKLIKEQGFQEVKIIEETRFPIKYMANDPTAKAVIEDANITMGNVKEIANAAVSIKVHAVKPKK